MEKEFVIYPLALRMKTLGFDEPCLGIYNADECKEVDLIHSQEWLDELDCPAPLFQQAFRWFREKYDWTIKVNQVTNNNWSYTLSNFPNDGKYYGELYKTYEEAELACLTKLIEIAETIKENDDMTSHDIVGY